MIQIIRELSIQKQILCKIIIINSFSMESTSPKLYDWQAFEHIAPYLNIGELMKTSTLSKQYNYTLRNYLRKHILPKESLQGAHNQLTLMKKIFNRQIRIFRLNDSHRSSHTPNLILKDLQVGTNYALIQTFQGKKNIVQISQLVNHLDLKIFIEIDKKFNGKFTTLIGDYLFTVLDNKLLKIAVKQTEEGLFTLEQEVDLEVEIVALKQSQTHIFAITRNTFQQQKVFAIHIKQFKSVEVLYEQVDKQTKQLDADDLSVGANVAYYINKFKVYELDVGASKQPKIFKSLKDKQISRIINGAKHFFAIQKGRKLTSQWDTKELIEWANKEGYEDYVKIFKSEKVTGQTLLKMDKKYMEDVLGIINVKVQQRLMVQLQEFNVESEQNCPIYGWGRNDKSQLGLNPSNPVSNPHKVTLPEGFKFLKCFNNITLIHNKKAGQISMSSAHEGKLVWQPIFSQVPNIWSISVSKDYIMILSPVEKDSISKQFSEAPVDQKKQKLRTAKNIIDKIQWDENINKKEFRVGYLDKFTGILQISFDELLISTQIKDYRIEYFKRNGEVVWSKKDRIDIL